MLKKKTCTIARDSLHVNEELKKAEDCWHTSLLAAIGGVGVIKIY